MTTRIDEVEDMLRLGCCMGPGERYLMLYEGQLAITNHAGLAHWPKGRRKIIAIFGAADCVHELTSRQWAGIIERLQRLKSSTEANKAEHSGGAIVKLSLQQLPT